MMLNNLMDENMENFGEILTHYCSTLCRLVTCSLWRGVREQVTPSASDACLTMICNGKYYALLGLYYTFYQQRQDDRLATRIILQGRTSDNLSSTL